MRKVAAECAPELVAVLRQRRRPEPMLGHAQLLRALLASLAPFGNISANSVCRPQRPRPLFLLQPSLPDLGRGGGKEKLRFRKICVLLVK